MGWLGRRKSGESLGSGQKGFTMIELLIMIAVLGALAAVVVPVVGSFLNTAKLAAANVEASNVKTAEMAYLVDNDNVFPANSDLLEAGNYLSAPTKYATYYFSLQYGTIIGFTNKAGNTFTFDVPTQLWIK